MHWRKQHLHDPEVDDDAGDTDEGRGAPIFVCSSCGRTDLSEAGDWDPPICQECDAAINEDALHESDLEAEGW